MSFKNSKNDQRIIIISDKKTKAPPSSRLGGNLSLFVPVNLMASVNLNKQVYVCLVGFAEVAYHTGKLHPIDKLFLAYAHDIHRHGAGHYFNT
jgi:hypothetical protein